MSSKTPICGLVSITCDPNNDTPEAMIRYADRLHADPANGCF